MLTASTRSSASGGSSASGRQRARAEVAGVVDQQVEARRRRRRRGRRGARGRRRRRATAVTSSGCGSAATAAASRPASRASTTSRQPRSVQRGGEGAAEAAGGAGDECGGWSRRHGATVGPQVNLRSRGRDVELLAIGEVAGAVGHGAVGAALLRAAGADRARPGPPAAPGGTRAACCAGWPSSGPRRTSGCRWRRSGRRWRPCPRTGRRRRPTGPGCPRAGGTGSTSRSPRSTQLRDGLTSCIGCGCLSLDRCALSNPGDVAGRDGAGRALAAAGPAPAAAGRLNRRLRCLALAAVAGAMIGGDDRGRRDDRHARRVLRPRQPDERAGEEPVHRGLARVRPGGAPAPGDPGGLRALVRAGHRGHRDAAPAHDPRLLRLPAASSSTSTTRRPACPSCTRRSPTSSTRPGWAPTWTAGGSTTAPGRC